MKNKFINVKKKDFLESVRDVYSDCSTNYLIVLRDALNIVISSRVNDSVNFDDYKGRVTL